MKIYKKLTRFINRYRNMKNDYINIDYEFTKTLLNNDKDAILLDVRSPQEYREMHLPKSINIPLYNIDDEIEYNIENKNNTIIVYCQSGGRSKSACKILINKDYRNVYNLEGGLDAI